jgi:hypothetical protein
MSLAPLSSQKDSRAVAATTAKVPSTVVKDEHLNTNLLLDTSDSTAMLDTTLSPCYNKSSPLRELTEYMIDTKITSNGAGLPSSDLEKTTTQPLPSSLYPSSPIPMINISDSLPTLHATSDTPLVDPPFVVRIKFRVAGCIKVLELTKVSTNSIDGKKKSSPLSSRSTIVKPYIHSVPSMIFSIRNLESYSRPTSTTVNAKPIVYLEGKRRRKR